MFRTILSTALCAMAALGAVATAVANDYPARPVRIIHGFAPGGAADVVARLAAQSMMQELKAPFVVESKPGAGGNIAAKAVANAPADGYTIGLVTGGHAVSNAVYKKPPFDAVKDFQMVSMVVAYRFILAVRPDHPAQTLRDVIELAKAKPDTLAFGSAGVGTTQHLAMESLQATANFHVLHIPYKGEIDVANALLAGDVPMALLSAAAFKTHADSGKLRAIAVSSSERWPVFPGVPTIAESGVPGFEVRTWLAFLAPRGTPELVVARLNRAIQTLLANPELKLRIEAAVAGEAKPSTPEEMGTIVARDVARWNDVVRAAKYMRE